MKQFTVRLLTILALAIALLAMAPRVGLAQSKSVVVPSRDADVTIQTNGDMVFDETWNVRFIGGSFSFAFRCIEQGRFDSISDWGVTQNGINFSQGSGRAGTYQLYTENGQSCIKWYFAPTSNAQRTFTLHYTVQGGLRIYQDGDQFYWNFIESDRGYTIDSATVTLHLPGNFTPDQIRATTAENFGERPSGARVVDGSTVVFSGTDFTAGDVWTLRAQFPHGIVNAPTPSWQAAEDQRAQTEPIVNFLALALSGLALIGGGLGLYVLWYTQGRDRPAGVVAEFYPTPPTDDPPGVAGVLLDERADMQDIVATIVDLARRGILRMTEKTQPGFLGIGSTRDFTFELVGETDGLRPYEQTLVSKLFGSHQKRELEDLKEKFYKYLPDLKKQMYQETVRLGYYKSSPQDARTRYSVLGIAALVVLGCIGFTVFGVLVDITPLAVCPLIALGVLGIALIIIAQFMPRRTDQGATATAKWSAFRRYLANIEKYTNVAEAKELFDKYLPYAIAFGLEHSWVNKFAAVDTPAPTWYFPYGGFGYGYGHRRGGVLSGDDGVPGIGGSLSGGGAERGGGRLPSLNEAAAGGFRGLNSMSDGLFSMLSTTASIFTSAPSSRGGGGGGGGWSGGGGGFGGGGGGGSSGFG